MGIKKQTEFHSATNFRNNSWGRTRCPKNIISFNHSSPTSVLLTGTGGGPNKTSSEYLTENQRFLHISHIGSGASAIQVQVYTFATDQWTNFGSSITVGTSRVHEVIQIYGVDKIRFVVSGLANAETCTIFPAASTF
jgi:hypothetical protein